MTHMNISPIYFALLSICAALCGAHFHAQVITEGSISSDEKTEIRSLSMGNLPRNEVLFVQDPESGPTSDGIGTVVKESVVTLIPTVTNPWLSAYNIDFRLDRIFNPAVISLPSYLSRDGYKRIFAVGRRWIGNKVVEGKSFSVTALVGCFLERANPNAHQKRPYTRCIAPGKELDLPSTIGPVRARIDTGKSLNLDTFLGAEDPRLLWSDSGAPIIVYGQISTRMDRSRTIFVVDARVAFPQLVTLMVAGKRSPPIVFSKQTELIAPTRDSATEKNWVIFFVGDVMYAQVTIMPRLLVRHNDDGYMSKNIIPEGKAQDGHCLYQVFREKDVILHQASNAVRVTLCNRYECTPSVSNTVFMSIFHRRFYYPNLCERFVVTWNITEPFEYISVSKRIEYIGISPDKFAFTTTLAFNDDSLSISEGYLDSLAIISVGVDDNRSSMVVTEASKLLADHVQCA